ncbi:hypothetical protein PROFUN_08352 [Planoprotostelium fungivorum]|uniref:Uncharacterized protein n=1 Tax=Planoprotostelium fungivorum TaxID=1890364 RepID=A0A2P6NI35_9EUKA|nr:hypothetical protein PROFUN_08352 [Planoprotostelium fungivorum]
MPTDVAAAVVCSNLTPLSLTRVCYMSGKRALLRRLRMKNNAPLSPQHGGPQHTNPIMYGQSAPSYYAPPTIPYMNHPINMPHNYNLNPYGYSYGHSAMLPPPMSYPITTSSISPSGDSANQPAPNNDPQNLKAIEDYIVSLLNGGAKISEPESRPVEPTNQEEIRKLESTVEAEHNLEPPPESVKPKRNLKNLPKKTTPIITDPQSFIQLTDECVALFNELKPIAGEYARRMKVLKRLNKLIYNYFSDGKPQLHLFGSSANNFGMKNADMDISLVIDEKHVGSPKRIVLRLGDILKRKRMLEVVCLPRARVPIVKFKDEFSELSCDICINNTLAIHNTQLISTYSKIDIRARQLGYVIKHWAKCRQINEPYQGTLSSYAWIVMALHYLQTRNPPILPVLQNMTAPGEERKKVEVEGHDVYFYSNWDSLREFGTPNTSSLGELVTGFFRLYAEEFDWNDSVVSLRTGGYLTKEEKQWAKQTNDRDNILLTIEDPFEVTHNLGRLVDRSNLKVIKYEFKRAYKLAASGKPLSKICEEYVADTKEGQTQ